MKKINVSTKHSTLIADTVTPVSVYLKLRDRFAGTILLESSDYHGNENSFSYICFQPVAEFKATGKQLSVHLPGQSSAKETLEAHTIHDRLKSFAQSFNNQDNTRYKFITNGIFGYMGYPAVQYFEQIELNKNPRALDIPDILYRVYGFVLCFDHFKNEVHIFQHEYNDEPSQTSIDEIIDLIHNKNFPTYTFEPAKDESTNFTDAEFMEIVEKGIGHCQRGDVFQIVLSRRFQQSFKGDEFNVYRALRSINPSPYLFYFDYGNFKIFGSSPEAQLVIQGRKASIFPIAGTFRRTGNDAADAGLAAKLADDIKENSEHVMLVDLARNDLSRYSDGVKVETFKEVQFFSHVIHLVSKVTGELQEDAASLDIVGSTFPAGTLSGAPKYKAMELIDTYENTQRGYYGGAIGFLGFNGDFNHAIMIRSFLSQHNQLTYQAGAGVVAKSNPENEKQEVNNKLEALRKAISMAGEINR